MLGKIIQVMSEQSFANAFKTRLAFALNHPKLHANSYSKGHIWFLWGRLESRPKFPISAYRK